MRKILISLLLAGVAATPALAGPNDRDDRQQSREEHQQARQERQQARQESRSERSAERPSFNARSSEAPQAQSQPQFIGNPNAGNRDAARDAMRAERMEARSDRGNFSGRGQGQASDYVAPGPRVATAPTSRGGRMIQIQQDRQERIDARELRQSNRALPNVMRTRNPLVVSNTPRPGTQPPLRTENRRTPEIRWATNWRNNDRYDWRNYRHHHRSHFHLGFYFDPFGWGYSPFEIGWRLWPAYYGSRYWIDDPWSYRLPYAPPGYRWIRYWNDALLVDLWTGEVVDVIPNFFW